MQGGARRAGRGASPLGTLGAAGTVPLSGAGVAVLAEGTGRGSEVAGPTGTICRWAARDGGCWAGAGQGVSGGDSPGSLAWRGGEPRSLRAEVDTPAGMGRVL